MSLYARPFYYFHREVVALKFSYNRLWKLLIDKGHTKKTLREMTGVSTNIIAKLGRNEPVSMETLGKICVALDCELEDIAEIIKEEPPK
jgi:DNA-binding Xre family transcriptional regulator